MKTLVPYVVLMLGALQWAGCCNMEGHEIRGSGKLVKEIRETGDFTGVALMTLGDLEIEIGDREELWIEAEDNLLAMIETKVADNVLEIKQRGNTCLSASKPVRYHVTLRRLDRVVHAAGGRVRIPKTAAEHLFIKHRGSGLINAVDLELRALSIHVSGSGNVTLGDVAMQRTRLVLSGSGNVSIRKLVGLSNSVRLSGSGDILISSGSVLQHSAFLSGSGDYEAKGLRSLESEVMVSGSGSAYLYAENTLDATITGRGGISYRGDPLILKSVTGSGKLKAIR